LIPFGDVCGLFGIIIEWELRIVYFVGCVHWSMDEPCFGREGSGAEEIGERNSKSLFPIGGCCEKKRIII